MVYNQYVPPDGPLDENEVLEIAEHLIRMKAKNYVFKGYDYDDICQEIRMSCIKALPKFEEKKTKGNPLKYFNTVSENHLRNLKRDKLYSFRPPCERCPYARTKNDKYDRDFCGKYNSDKSKCKEYNNYLKLFEAKVNLANPIPIYTENSNEYIKTFLQESKYMNDSMVEDIIAFNDIVRLLPEQYREHLKSWLGGDEKIPSWIKQRIIKLLRLFLKDKGV